MSRNRSLIRIATVAGVLAAVEGGSPARAFSAGSPICEVHTLPLVEMSATLAQPPPEGWQLSVSSRVYFPGQPVQVAVRNPDPGLEVRGLLLWARSGPNQGGGRFELPADARWQYMPASSNCGEWALSHVDGLPKPQPLLRFDWIPDDRPTAVLRAFLIQHCDADAGGCRDQQGLTPVLALERGIFRAGFE